MNKFNWTDSKLEEFIDSNYEEFLEDWIKKLPGAWDEYMDTIAKPFGRPYCSAADSTLELFSAFSRWHKSQSKYHVPFVRWIEDNLPDYDSETGGDGPED